MQSRKIQISTDQEKALIKSLEKRDDFEAKRIKRYLGMPDLTRQQGSPIKEMVDRILAIPELADFDQIEAPEIVPADISFDFFNFPLDHPARSKSDTYYIDDKNILRTHTTVMWYYYLHEEKILEQIKKNAPLGLLSFGKVYRKDEIDRQHMNVFHQMDGLYLHPAQDRKITVEDLKSVLAKIAQAVFGAQIKFRFNKDTFPYTDPSLEMEIDKSGQWVEVLGSGLVQPVVLKNLGVDPKLYTGWAYGFGIERLAIISMELPDIRLLWSEDERVVRQLKLGRKFEPVSKFPPIPRDVSFVVREEFILNDYFDMIREVGGDLVEEVRLLDKYVNEEKFGTGKTSYTFRIIYRSNDRTLEAQEIEPMQARIYERTASQFGAEVR